MRGEIQMCQVLLGAWYPVHKVIDKTEFKNVHLNGIKINAEKNEDKSDNMARQKLNVISPSSITSLNWNWTTTKISTL